MEVEARFPSDRLAPLSARRALDRLAEEIPNDAFDSLQLLVTEVVTNSFRHTETADIRLKVRVVASQIEAQVCDNGEGFDPATLDLESDPWETGGRGLFLVDQLAKRWGVKRGKATCVWFEVPYQSEAG